MMKKFKLILAALLLTSTAAYGNFQCGLKPLPPLGCTQNDAVCICDEYGCRWVFICN
jgi:hypothetical protein